MLVSVWCLDFKLSLSSVNVFPTCRHSQSLGPASFQLHWLQDELCMGNSQHHDKAKPYPRRLVVPSLTLSQPNYNKCPFLRTQPKLHSSLVSTTNHSVHIKGCSNKGDVETSSIILPSILLRMGLSPVVSCGFGCVYHHHQ